MRISFSVLMAETWSYRGLALCHLEKYEDALASCNRALEIDKEYVRAWSTKALVLKSMGKYEDSLKCCEEALRLDLELETAKETREELLKILK